jgi:hypothetical protein
MWTMAAPTTAPRGPWIRSASWDFTFILGSAVLAGFPIVSYYLITALTGVPPQAFQEHPALSIAMAINMASAFLIGGPHLYATFTMTIADRSFRASHRRLLWLAALIPPLVVSLAVLRVELLMTLFFAWASVHAVHQLVFIVEQYQMRADRPHGLPRWSKAIDYVLLMSCLYPVVSWRLLATPGSMLALPGGVTVAQGFRIGAVDLSRELPAFIHGQVWIAWALFAIFAAALLAFVLRTGWELATGTGVWPRTLLLGATVPLVSSIPLYDNLDVALQGLNLWHSTQYIGLVYLMNAYRKERGELTSPLLGWLAGFGNGFRYYGAVVGVSVAAGGLIGVLHYGCGLPMLHCYYGVHLSALWINYLWDHAVFTRVGALAPVAAIT